MKMKALLLLIIIVFITVGCNSPGVDSKKAAQTFRVFSSRTRTIHLSDSGKRIAPTTTVWQSRKPEMNYIPSLFAVREDV